MNKTDIYTVFKSSGEKELTNSEQLNQILHTDNFQFYTTGDRLKDFLWNKDLKRWEYNKLF